MISAHAKHLAATAKHSQGTGGGFPLPSSKPKCATKLAWTVDFDDEVGADWMV